MRKSRTGSDQYSQVASVHVRAELTVSDRNNGHWEAAQFVRATLSRANRDSFDKVCLAREVA